jgi:hypothetical protein
MFGHNEPFAYGGVLSGKNSAGVNVGDGEGDVDLSGEALEVFAGWAATSPCSFCASGISPTRCFSHEQIRSSATITGAMLIP